MKYSQIIRAIIYLITMINTILTTSGHNPIPFSDSEIYLYVSIGVMIVVFAYGVWKNFPTSKAGITGDAVMHAIKQGVIQAQDVLNLLDNGAVGGFTPGMIFAGRNRVTQAYNYNAKTKAGHGGIDVVGDDDLTVHSVCNGKVYMISKWDGKTKTGTQSYGNLIVALGDDGNRYYYAHLAEIRVSKGQRVNSGDAIGVMGNTGNSFGAHTHFEMRTGSTVSTRINPAPFCGVQNAKGTYYAEEFKEPTAAVLYVTPNENLNIRNGAGTDCPVVIKDGAAAGVAYGITEEQQAGTQTWGKLADGRGWICLAYCSKVGQALTALYNVRVIVGSLNVRTGYGIETDRTGITVNRNEVYGIVEEKKVGSQMWGKLQSGAGCICLAYCVKV